ncbi:MAG: hypothetical protein A3H31_06860 [Gallionellales bacterium RIFCSPLOWO2_02_FULL_57_47]|nr:MAG: hypothetical protein A3H31_06860 [Gallionellales bacterium RIFCSPLOWO2_02_FULL_57_47]
MVDQVDVDQTARIELSRQPGIISLHRVVWRHVVEHAERRQAYADLVLADRIDHGIGHLEHEARPVFDRAAVAIRALVRVRADELFEQIAVRPVQLDAVESRSNGVLRGLREFPYRGPDVRLGHRLRHAIRFHTLGIGVHFSVGCYRRRRQQPRACGQVERMADAAAMHQLHEHFRALRVNRTGNALPSGNLFRRKYPGDARIAQPVGGRRGAFGDDEAGGCPLRVILHHQVVRDVAGGAIACHRRHDHAVLQRERAQSSC